MKLITLQQIGYNTPSQANWSYTIFTINMVDTEREYCYAMTVKSCFAGEENFKHILKTAVATDLITQAQTPIKLITMQSFSPNQKLTGINKMRDIDSKEVITTIHEFLAK